MSAVALDTDDKNVRDERMAPILRRKVYNEFDGGVPRNPIVMLDEILYKIQKYDSPPLAPRRQKAR